MRWLFVLTIGLLGCAAEDEGDTSTSGADPGQCACKAYSPVCGVDGMTHNAGCGMECVEVEVACSGECPCGATDGTMGTPTGTGTDGSSSGAGASPKTDPGSTVPGGPLAQAD